VRIAVLMGGSSDERDVSLSSGVQVAGALRTAGHDVLAVDTATGPMPPADEAAIAARGVDTAAPGGAAAVGASAGGAPSLDAGAGERRLMDLTLDPALADVDLYFLALHGGTGEDGTVQALLDALGLPYTGSDRLGCSLAMDKDVSKRLLRDAGVPTPPWMTGTQSADRVESALGLPVIVKASGGGSSLRLILAHDRAELESALAAARGFGDLTLLEAYVPGREFTVGVLGDEPLPVGEIVPEHEIFDYACKYEPGLAREIFPADLPADAAQRLQQAALDVHRTLRLRDYSRVDFIVDDGGTAWCLEANALPGMTANSLMPKAARAAGLELPDLCDRIARMALARV
jgi:D-alanine-D-alanine ligase